MRRLTPKSIFHQTPAGELGPAFLGVISSILENSRDWAVLDTFCEAVMPQKEDAEQEGKTNFRLPRSEMAADWTAGTIGTFSAVSIHFGDQGFVDSGMGI